MSGAARLIGLGAATVMFVFSAWMYQSTGDWVHAFSVMLNQVLRCVRLLTLVF